MAFRPPQAAPLVSSPSPLHRDMFDFARACASHKPQCTEPRLLSLGEPWWFSRRQSRSGVDRHTDPGQLDYRGGTPGVPCREDLRGVHRPSRGPATRRSAEFSALHHALHSSPAGAEPARAALQILCRCGPRLAQAGHIRQPRAGLCRCGPRLGALPVGSPGRRGFACGGRGGRTRAARKCRRGRHVVPRGWQWWWNRWRLGAATMLEEARR